KKLEKNFYLKGNSINIGKRSFLLEQGPYRNIWRGKDKDLWRRLVLQDKIVWLVHKPFWKRMREKRNFQQTTRMLFDAWVNDFRTGVMLKGYIIHLAHTKKIKNPLFWYACIACPIAWFFASYKGFLDRDRKPIQYYLKKIKKVQNRLVELEQKYHFNIDKTKLSKKGLIIFYDK
ncbi:MAG: hypothetical protein KAS07_05415, partial [Candidatus Pacebacteria bacterium]|nr:hypothetical protein [Candidatus Paceibacterota bacterium]